MKWFGLASLQDNLLSFFLFVEDYITWKCMPMGLLPILVSCDFLFHPDMILCRRCIWYVIKEISPFFSREKRKGSNVLIWYSCFFLEVVLKRKKKMGNPDTDLIVNCKTTFFFFAAWIHIYSQSDALICCIANFSKFFYNLTKAQ